MEELLTPAEMARADAVAVALGHPVAALMAQAGRAVARAIRARIAPCRALVLCGPGNNGGDGLAAARYLARRGWPVAVASLHDAALQGAARDGAWACPRAPFTPTEAARRDLVIDAVFGAGLSRDLDPRVEATLAAARRVVAIDVPSGLDGATGQPRGAVRAAGLTVTFFRRKPGHLLLPGRLLCGELVLADIGLPAAVLETVRPHTWRNTPALWTLPEPDAASHKYRRGHASVVGGAAMTGAARLAAEGARRAGAGLVSIAAQGSAATYRAGAAGVIVDDAPLADQLGDARRQVWVCGPGLGAAARPALAALLAAGRQVVADADALAGDPACLRGAAVLTPHAGEFARVFGTSGADRLAAARAAAARTSAVIVLKGADTLIAAPDGRVAINDNAPPFLATAGAGDVLAGMIAGLIAQSMPAWQAACAAVWLHGEAARLAGPGLIAEELAPLLARAFAAARGYTHAG
ncbi:MAG: NAD(P)H-hydrate dehydratase [Rhodospirillales bacterium]|nr:NAD(P)H-hydrate dehydratase [Rhodospirillales bacterium]